MLEEHSTDIIKPNDGQYQEPASSMRLSKMSEEEASALFESRKQMLVKNLMTHLKRSNSNSSNRATSNTQKNSSATPSNTHNILKKRMSLQVTPSSQQKPPHISELVSDKPLKLPNYQQQRPQSSRPQSARELTTTKKQQLLQQPPILKKSSIDATNTCLIDQLSSRTSLSSSCAKPSTLLGSTATFSRNTHHRPGYSNQKEIVISSSNPAAAAAAAATTTTANPSPRQLRIDLLTASPKSQSPDGKQRSHLKSMTLIQSTNQVTNVIQFSAQKISSARGCSETPRPNSSRSQQKQNSYVQISQDAKSFKNQTEKLSLQKPVKDPVTTTTTLNNNKSISPASGIKGSNKQTNLPKRRNSSVALSTTTTINVVQNQQSNDLSASSTPYKTTQNEQQNNKSQTFAIMKRELERQKVELDQLLKNTKGNTIGKGKDQSQSNSLTSTNILQQQATLNNTNTPSKSTPPSPCLKQKKLQFCNIPSTSATNSGEKTPLKSILVNRKNSGYSNERNVQKSAEGREDVEITPSEPHRINKEIKQKFKENFNKFKVFFNPQNIPSASLSGLKVPTTLEKQSNNENSNRDISTLITSNFIDFRPKNFGTLNQQGFKPISKAAATTNDFSAAITDFYSPRIINSSFQPTFVKLPSQQQSQQQQQEIQVPSQKTSQLKEQFTNVNSQNQQRIEFKSLAQAFSNLQNLNHLAFSSYRGVNLNNNNNSSASSSKKSSVLFDQVTQMKTNNHQPQDPLLNSTIINCSHRSQNTDNHISVSTFDNSKNSQ